MSVNKIFTQTIIINNWNDELFGIDRYNIPKVLHVNNVKNL